MTTNPFKESETILSLKLEAMEAINKSEKDHVRELFQKAEDIFVSGSVFTRTLIANLFVLPITEFLEIHYAWGKNYLALLPENLNLEYKRQVNSSGI